MDLLIGKAISVSVDMVCTSLVPPMIARGRVTLFDGEAYEIEIDAPVPPVSSGSQVILDFTDGDLGRVIASVSEVHGRMIRVSGKTVSHQDKRAFPRLYGSVKLAYRRLAETESDSAVEAWLSGGLEEAGATWLRPDPFMNFSVTGLKFEDAETCNNGDTLLLEFSVPTTTKIFRCRSRVARVAELEPGTSVLDHEDSVEYRKGQAPPTHSVAVEFEDMPRDGREALSEFTLLIQGVLL
jgi:hypothetical protein